MVYEIRKRGNYKFFRIFERFDENWGNVWTVSLENATRVRTYVHTYEGRELSVNGI